MPKFARRTRRMYRRAYGSKLTKRQKKEVKQIIGRDIETKVVYIDSNIGDVDDAGDLVEITNLVPQGLVSGDRIGDEIITKRLTISYHIEYQNPANPSADAYQTIRVILFRYLGDPSAVAMTASKVKSEMLVGNSGTYPINWMINHEYKSFYHVFYDRNHTVYPTPTYNGTTLYYAPAGLGASTYVTKVINDKEIVGKKVHWIEDGATDLPSKGQLYCFMISDSTALTINHPAAQIAFKYEYKDA